MMLAKCCVTKIVHCFVQDEEYLHMNNVATYLLWMPPSGTNVTGIQIKLQNIWLKKLHLKTNIRKMWAMVQDGSNSIANALELLQPCAKPLKNIYEYILCSVNICSIKENMTQTAVTFQEWKVGYWFRDHFSVGSHWFVYIHLYTAHLEAWGSMMC